MYRFTTCATDRSVETHQQGTAHQHRRSSQSIADTNMLPDLRVVVPSSDPADIVLVVTRIRGKDEFRVRFPVSACATKTERQLVRDRRRTSTWQRLLTVS